MPYQGPILAAYGNTNAQTIVSDQTPFPVKTVSNGNAQYSHSKQTVGTTSGVLLAAGSKKFLLVYNTSTTSKIYLNLSGDGTDALSDGTHLPIEAGGQLLLTGEFAPTHEIRAITDTGSVNVHLTIGV